MRAVAITRRHAPQVGAVERRSFSNIMSKLVNLIQKLSFFGHVKGAYFLEFYAQRPAEYLVGFFIGDEGSRFGIAACSSLVGIFFELVDAREWKPMCKQAIWSICRGRLGDWMVSHAFCAVYLQLLEIAVGNIMTAPVRNSIELNAVRELHLVLGFNPLPLAVSILLSSVLEVLCVFARPDVAELVEFVCVDAVVSLDDNKVV